MIKLATRLTGILWISLTLLALPAVASAQQGTWFSLYESTIMLPSNTVATITITNAPNVLRAACTAQETTSYYGYWPGARIINASDTWLATTSCTNAGNSAQVSGVQGQTLRVVFVATEYGTSNLDVGIYGYNYINQEGDGGYSETPAPFPTATPEPTSAPVPTSSGGAGNNCGTAENPCYVVGVDENGTPIAGSGGGTSSTVVVQFPSAISVDNWPTAEPTATTLPAIAQAEDYANNPPSVGAVSGTYEGALSLGNMTNTGDTWTAGINGELWDFGCPIDNEANGIGAKVCIKYQYIENIRLIGFDLPVGLICQSMLVLAVVYIIKTR